MKINKENIKKGAKKAKESIKKGVKRGRFLAQLWDGPFSAFMSLVLFVLAAIGMQKLFGDGVGFYDPAIFQAPIAVGAGYDSSQFNYILSLVHEF